MRRFCWKCWLLGVKHKVPGHLDFLWVTARSTCTKHRQVGPLPVDLASAFDTEQKALDQMWPAVRHSERLLEAAIAWREGIYDRIVVTREKAKSLLQLTAVVFSVLIAGASLLADRLTDYPAVALGVYVIVLLIAASQFIRSITISLAVLTREPVVELSLQDYCEILAQRSPTLNVVLSARTVVAANRTAALHQDRINLVIVAQTAFKWGIRYSALLLILHVCVLLLLKMGFTPGAPEGRLVVSSIWI